MAVLNLTTLANVKENLKLPAGTTEDAYLTRLIASVSREFEQHLARDLFLETRTEVKDSEQSQQFFFLRAYPVVSVTSVSTLTDTFPGAALSALNSTLWNWDPASGELAVYVVLPEQFRALSVVYLGGIASTTAGLITAEPTLSFACEMQVASEYRRRGTGSVMTHGGARGGRTGNFPSHKFLPRVEEMLEPYRAYLTLR